MNIFHSYLCVVTEKAKFLPLDIQTNSLNNNRALK